MKITPEILTGAAQLFTGILTMVEDNKKEKAARAAETPAAEPEDDIVDAVVHERNTVSSTFDGSEATPEEVAVLQSMMDRILPEPMGLVTQTTPTGEAIAWRQAISVLDGGTNLLVWGFLHLIRQGFTLSDDVAQWEPELKAACKRAMLDWYGVPADEVPQSYREAE